ncbi:MAG: DoxX family membrane protein [bacterium]|nr:DoxX family membrane protein [bacterium]
MSKITQARWLLRVALAFVFFYAAIQSIRVPEAWVDWIPRFVVALSPVSPTLLLDGASIAQIGLGLWLLSGRNLRWAAGFAALFLFSVTVFNLRFMDVVFRDFSLGLAALALVVLAPDES